MTFDDLIAPMSAEEFFRDYWGKKPVLLPGGAGNRRPRFGWDRFNTLFHIRPHWTEANVKLIMNSQPVDPDFYMEGQGPRLANVRQVENFLAMGASLVVDAVERIAPDIATLTDMLARRFGAAASANFYASFQGVQAFASHCDTHEVLALHCEGEKRWRIYQNRADNPLTTLTGEGAQQAIDAAKGAVMMEVTTRPGDLLYIPRGFFHDAIATDTASLHLTFGFAPLVGKILFALLEELAVEDSHFRAYLPAAEDEAGTALTERLSFLGDRVTALMRTRRFRDLVANEQRRLAKPPAGMSLPHRPALDFYARTRVQLDLATPESGAALHVAGRAVPVGALEDVARYIVERPAFSVEELQAKFAHQPPEEIAALVADLHRLGALDPYRPGWG